MEAEVHLQGLANFNWKSEGWIKADLSISKSSLMGRIFWKLVAKHFICLRGYFYGVNLAQSQASLLAARVQIKDQADSRLIALFNQAVHKFNILMPKYRVEEIIPDSSLPQASQTIDNFFPPSLRITERAMTFKVFNITHGLSETPEIFQSYDPENPPFNISCLSKAALDDFKQVVMRYDQFFKTGTAQVEDASKDDVMINIPEKKQILNVEILPFEETKMSHWHLKTAKILSQEASWKLHYEKSGRNAKIEALKKEVLGHVSYAAFKIETLCEQYKLLKLMTCYHSNCLRQLTELRVRKRTHSKPSFMGYKIPGFFCENFGNFLEEYLANLGTSILFEKQKLAAAMLSRLTVAEQTKDIKNGDLLFFLAKSIENLCKEKLLINEDKAQQKAIAIESLRTKLQDRQENPGAHAILDWQLIPNAPQISLNYKAYKIFWKLIVSLPEDNTSKSIKNKLASLRWFTEDSGIRVETIKYPEGLILVPKGDNESEPIKINSKDLKTCIPHPGAVIEMNEGFHALGSIMRILFSVSPASLGTETSQSLSQKSKASFQAWLKEQKNEDIKNLAEAIHLTQKGILRLCELLKKYDLVFPKKSIVENQIYALWSSELRRCLIKFNKYSDILILLFKESIEIPQVIYLAPVMRVIKQYADRLGNTPFSFGGKEKVESLFGTLRQVDAHFFTLFVDNLKHPKGGFIARAKDSVGLYTHDTEDSRSLLDLLAVMSPDLWPVMLIGNVWRGIQYPSLYELKMACKVFKEKIPSESIDELLHLLLKSLLLTLETENSEGCALLAHYHTEEVVKNPVKDTLLMQWTARNDPHHRP